MARYRFLEILRSVYVVVAWLGVAGGVIALLVADIADKRETVFNGVTTYERTVKGIGLSGVASILMATAIYFVVFIGFSQLIRLLLSLDEQVAGVARRLADVSIAIGEVRATQRQTAEHVRMVGEIVYEDAKK